MSYHIKALVFPRPGLRAVAAQNSDRTYTFYVGAHLSKEARKEAVKELACKIQDPSLTTPRRRCAEERRRDEAEKGYYGET